MPMRGACGRTHRSAVSPPLANPSPARAEGLKDAAAIASDMAAEIYGARILKRSIEDDRQNFVENAYKVNEALTCEHVMEIVPKEESGSAHCSVDDFTKSFNMYDWIASKLVD